MHKAVFVFPDINEGSIEALHNFADLANIDVTDLNLVASLVFVELNKLFVLQQRQLDFSLGNGYD